MSSDRPRSRGTTRSLCPVCLRPLRAEKTAEGGNVYLSKECPEHGRFQAMLWRGVESYDAWAVGSQHAHTADDQGGTSESCLRCGLCQHREGETCIAVFHLTDRCNLHCPVCFAQSSPVSVATDVPLAHIARMFEACAAKQVVPSVQLSGGEVTLREDLPEILRLGKGLGVGHIQVNTNGVRLADEPGYASLLQEAGADVIYLQFDGVSDGVYRALRGQNMFERKLAALERCREAGLAVLLVPTVFAGVNDHQLGDIVALAKQWMPTVRGVQFQPMSFFGRHPMSDLSDEKRVTLPDIVRALEAQTVGELPESAVVARRKFDSHCSFSSLFLLGSDGQLRALSSSKDLPALDRVSGPYDPFAADTVRFAEKYWRASSRRASSRRASSTCECQPDCCDELAAGLHRNILTVSGMAFQDAWSIDLERLTGCCLHVVTEGCDFIPLCAFYLTSGSGRRLCSLVARR